MTPPIIILRLRSVDQTQLTEQLKPFMCTQSCSANSKLGYLKCDPIKVSGLQFEFSADGVRIYSADYPVRCVAGTSFKPGVVTCDGMNIVVIGADKGSRDAIFVFHARTGSLLSKIPLKQSGAKV